MYKILFFGTSEFAIPSLEALARDKRFEVVGVVTQPDRPFGRHAEVTPPPIKGCFAHAEVRRYDEEADHQTTRKDKR
jgi:methionyl-tRNA formyltransferase